MTFNTRAISAKLDKKFSQLSLAVKCKWMDGAYAVWVSLSLSILSDRFFYNFLLNAFRGGGGPKLHTDWKVDGSTRRGGKLQFGFWSFSGPNEAKEEIEVRTRRKRMAKLILI